MNADERLDALVFSIATNAYDIVFRECISSHVRYASQHGYRYVLVRKPYWIRRNAAHDSSWLKVPLLLAALRRGYRSVMWIDADCLVRAGCPPFQSVFEPGKSIYAAHGFSGRMNAGMLIVRNSRVATSFFETMLQMAGKDVPVEDRASYENGLFIHLGKRDEAVHVIDSRWNNNRDPFLRDFVRHYTGPVGHDMKRTWRSRSVRSAVRACHAIQNALSPGAPVPLASRLRTLAGISARAYPEFFHGDPVWSPSWQ